MTFIRHFRLGAALLAILLGLSVLLPLAGAPPAFAQTSCSAKDLKPLIDSAGKTGGRVVCVDTGAKTPAASMSTVDLGTRAFDTMVRTRERLKELVLDSGKALPNMGAVLKSHSPRGSLLWIVHGILLGIAAAAIGMWVSLRLRQWAQRAFQRNTSPTHVNAAEKLGYLLFRALTMLIGATVMVLIAFAIVLALDFDNRAVRITAGVIVLGVAGLRVIHLIFFNILAPDLPGYRIVALSDEDAASLYRSTVGVAALSITLLGLSIWMRLLGLDPSTHKLLLVVNSLIAAIAFSGLFVRYRAQNAAIIRNAYEGETVSLWRRMLAASFHVLAVIYFIAAWLVSSMRIILDLGGAVGLIGAPAIAMIQAFVLYAVLLVVVDQVFKRRQAYKLQLYRERVARAERTGHDEAGEGEGTGPETELPAEVETEIERDVEREGEIEEILSRRPIFRDLMEHGAAILALIVGIGSLLDMWGLDFRSDSNPITRFIGVLLVGFAAYLAYQAVKIWVDSKIAEEEPGDAGGHDSETEIGGAGVSRLATLLPIFRNFLLITIVVIAGMIVLSELGVDIAPLFAGAGVVGLAIGFGAQALIRDIFSGAFFLMDDAFRRGEYINLGSIQGVVEKISLRSFQLRHHNGPLHTVPFGEIKQLTNFSRDWVIMKLKMRVTYDTDVEKVRKLVKKLGQELLSDPDIGPLFLEPLKSQGVVEMDDSAMIIRVKFMTKPGDQFMARRVVYTRIQELFEREGIHFAHREVTVRVADLDRPLTDEEKTAVAGAVRPVIDQQEEAR